MLHSRMITGRAGRVQRRQSMATPPGKTDPLPRSSQTLELGPRLAGPRGSPCCSVRARRALSFTSIQRPIATARSEHRLDDRRGPICDSRTAHELAEDRRRTRSRAPTRRARTVLTTHRGACRTRGPWAPILAPCDIALKPQIAPETRSGRLRHLREPDQARNGDRIRHADRSRARSRRVPSGSPRGPVAKHQPQLRDRGPAL